MVSSASIKEIRILSWNEAQNIASLMKIHCQVSFLIYIVMKAPSLIVYVGGHIVFLLNTIRLIVHPYRVNSVSPGQLYSMRQFQPASILWLCHLNPRLPWSLQREKRQLQGYLRVHLDATALLPDTNWLKLVMWSHPAPRGWKL